MLSTSLGTDDYLWPTDASKTITTVFGDIRPFRYHTGIDIRTYGINGLDIYAIEDGYVSRIATSPLGYGKVIYIKMKDGNTSVYAHLDKFNETLEIFLDGLQQKCNCFSIDHTFLPNQYPVKKGDVIGFTGDSGSLSGPHIHFEIRNKKGEPFNPFLTNYLIEDTLPPIPQKIILNNLNKDSFINGSPIEKEFDLIKISDNQYIIEDIISVSGEIGISAEIYDKINGQPFNFGLYSIKLEIDGETFFDAEYNHTNFNEGHKVFCERDFDKYNSERKKVYSLYKKNNYHPSSFIKSIPIKKIIFKDRSYHECKITASDYNGNYIEILFNLLSSNNRDTQIDFIAEKKGWIVQSYDDRLKLLNVYFTNDFDQNIRYVSPDIDTIYTTKFFIPKPKKNLNTLVAEPFYKDGTYGPPQFHKIDNEERILDGKINLKDKARGTAFTFDENNFSGKTPILGLTLDNKLYRYPLFQISPTKYTSEIFYPLELRDLSKVSIIYQDSTINQFSININSKVSIPEFPIKLIDNQITLNSISNSKKIIFDDSNHNDAFIYIEPYIDRAIEGQLNHIYGPFLIGPKSIPFKNEFNLIFENQKQYSNIGIFKYDMFNKKWKFNGNNKYEKGIQTKIKIGGIYSIIKDDDAPEILKKVPNVGSTYRKDHFKILQYEVKDELCGIRDENSFEVYLDGKKLIVDYNTYRSLIFYEFKKPLEIGTHQIELVVTDNCNNKKRIKGNFYIK